MGEQVVGLDVVLPDGSELHRHSQVRADNTGYDLTALFVGAEGTLGVITGLDLRLHPNPSHRVTAVCGFKELGAVVDAAQLFRELDGIAALELIDGRAAALTGEHAGARTSIRAASPLSVSTSVHSSDCGGSASRSPTSWASTVRR
jgi:FAD/FMN-containing dehydrogenase